MGGGGLRGRWRDARLEAREEGVAEGCRGVSARWKGGWAVGSWDERRTKGRGRFPGWIGPSKTSPEGLTEGFSAAEGAGAGSAGAGSGGAKAGGGLAWRRFRAQDEGGKSGGGVRARWRGTGRGTGSLEAAGWRAGDGRPAGKAARRRGAGRESGVWAIRPRAPGFTVAFWTSERRSGLPLASTRSFDRVTKRKCSHKCDVRREA